MTIRSILCFLGLHGWKYRYPPEIHRMRDPYTNNERYCPYCHKQQDTRYGFWSDMAFTGIPFKPIWLQVREENDRRIAIVEFSRIYEASPLMAQLLANAKSKYSSGRNHD